MKKILSIVSLIAMAMIANAQFTLTYEGNAITEGSTIPLTTSSKGNPAEDANIEMTLTYTGDTVGHWTLKGETGAENTFSVASVCGNRCQPGTTSNVDVNAGEDKIVSVHFQVPAATANGTTEIITVKLYNRTTGADDLTFTVALTYESNAGIVEATAAMLNNAYPNPAMSNVTIDFAVEGTAQLVLTDIMGREVMQQTIAGNGSTNINVENLHKGVYLYGIRQGNKQYAMKKLVVK